MKKLVVVIDDEKKLELEVDSLQIALDSYEGIDILITGYTLPVDTVEQETVAAIRPSGQGIEMGASFSTSQLVKEVPEGILTLEMKRNALGVEVIKVIDPTLHKITSHNHIVLATPYHPWNEVEDSSTDNAIVKSAKELASLEKYNTVKNQALFIEKEPHFAFTKEGNSFRIEEMISVYDTIAPISSATVIDPAKVDEEPKEVIDVEVDDLIEIFKELFAKNENSVKILLKGASKDFMHAKEGDGIATVIATDIVNAQKKDYDAAYEFFLGQAVLSTGNKIPREKVEKVLNTIIEEIRNTMTPPELDPGVIVLDIK
jgi:hypothetical protein